MTARALWVRARSFASPGKSGCAQDDPRQRPRLERAAPSRTAPSTSLRQTGRLSPHDNCHGIRFALPKRADTRRNRPPQPHLNVLGTNRQRAHRSFAEIFPFDPKRVVKTCPVILPGDRGSQLDQLSLVEILSQTSKQCVRYFDRGLGHAVGVFEDEPFQS